MYFMQARRLFQKNSTLLEVLRSKTHRFSTETSKTFDKILIANRGEIACRIIKTCRKMGIKTVAVYSDPDAKSVHVRMADEAVRVGPAPSSQSYLNIQNIIDACTKTGAQAVHPGYGFLSEKEAFAEALEKSGITFIGPPPKALRSLGDKLASKQLARSAGVNTVPGGHGKVENAQEVLRIASEIGYPVMIKASAGGGGKGMRIAWNDKEALDGYRLSKAEAKSSFGDDTILIEKFIDQPRHIEVQLLGDQFGNAIYLFERECSIQRRNQKVYEEAPSVFLDDKTRAEMGAQAVSLAKAAGYYSAGTCEFLVDPKRNFYFLEMNTRLQVEHPVTEQITGLDLVELMIRIAAKQRLPIKQEQLKIKGWALEARVYAEDATRGFVPCIGKLQRYREPRGVGVRVDSGIEEGAEISIHYDPMISKLITYGDDRESCLQRMRKALDEYVIHGLTHNIAFLRDIVDNPRFIKGDISTKFIPTEYPHGFKGTVLSSVDTEVVISAAVLVFSQKIANQVAINNGKLSTFDPHHYIRQKVKELVVLSNRDGQQSQFFVQVKDFKQNADEQQLECVVSPATVHAPTGALSDAESFKVLSNYKRGKDFFTVKVGPNAETEYTVQVSSSSDGEPLFNVQLRGTGFDLEIRTPREYELLMHMPVTQEVDQSRMVLSPMPGAVVSIAVQPGDQVIEGQEVCVLEAMKMQNALLAKRSGKVKAVRVKVGATVNGNDVLVELE